MANTFVISTMVQRIFILSVILSISVLSRGQDVPIGQWRDHLPYRSIKLVAEGEGAVYAAGAAGIIRVDLEDNSAQRFSTVEGLAEVAVSALGASPDGSVVLVGYESGVFDIIRNNSVTHIYDVFRSNVIGDKSINHFMFHNDRCYISTGFGIVEYDYNKTETRETFLIGENGDYVFVNQSHFFNDTLWAATDIGLYYAAYSSILYDPKNWSQDTSLPDSVRNYDIVSSMGSELMVNAPTEGFRTDTLYSRVNGIWGINPFRLGESNNWIESYGDKVVVSASTSMEVYNTDWSVIRREFSAGGEGITPNCAVLGKDDVIWMGDEFNGLIKNLATQNNEVINLGGPATNRAFNVFYDQNKVFVTGGAHATNWFTLKQPGEFSYLKNDSWTIFNRSNVEELSVVSDITSVTVDPDDDEHFFVSSLNDGVFEFRNDKLINQYNQLNSILDTIDLGICFVSDIKYDSEGNLWMLNSQVSKPIVLLTRDGEWYSFPVAAAEGGFQTGRLTITSDNNFWITSPTSGLMVYSPGENIKTASDDRSRNFNASPGEGNLPDNETNCAIEDEDGQIWVGTRAGLRVFFNASGVFSSSFGDAQDVLLDQDGQTKILLENENVSWIAIDGANRKWLATRSSGVYHMSADGTQELNHFTKEDSPLFSDFLNSIAINGENGEVLMATDQGLIGYRGDATSGGNSFSDVYAFPNPVQPGYVGVIAITGLVDGTIVKITDAGGNLVFETTSAGGQATWSGNNLQGQKVATGVYFVAASGNDGEERAVTKILFLR